MQWGEIAAISHIRKHPNLAILAPVGDFSYVGSGRPRRLLKEREDLIAQRMRSTNASGISKISKIYALVDELGTAAKDFVACKNGCAACCHMNVTISPIEAKHIETATGKAPAPLSQSRTHDLAEFSGKPCPFLKDSSCSIYNVRPFACRNHVSFDITNYWCQPERSHQKVCLRLSLMAPKRPSLA
jgi:Fe-S-cluster containining protein